jgi:multiple sugar transport system permease protein
MFNLVIYIVLTIGALAMFLPFVWMVSSSLKQGAAISELPPKLIPNPVDWEYFVTVWGKVNFARYTFNTFFVVILDVIGSLLSCAVVGFGLAMFNFKLKRLIYASMLATLMLPGQVSMIPHYFIWKMFHSLNTYIPLVVPSFLGSAFGVFLMHQFYKSLSKEYFEAALIDGYGVWSILWRIYVPLAKPALTVLVVFVFQGAWNSTVGPLIYLHDTSKFTLSLGLYMIKGDNLIPEQIKLAGAVITTIPVVLVFLAAQRQFMSGFSVSGGLKG